MIRGSVTSSQKLAYGAVLLSLRVADVGDLLLLLQMLFLMLLLLLQVFFVADRLTLTML